MVSVHASGVVDLGLKPGRVIPKTIKLMYLYYSLNTEEYEQRLVGSESEQYV